MDGRRAAGVALWCPTLLGMSLARGLALADQGSNRLVFEGPDWYSRFAHWIQEIDPETQDKCTGMDLSGPVEEPLPLNDLIIRLETRWIDEALLPGALTAHLQPILRIDNLTVIGFESLARSNADGRLISAGELIRAAEVHRKVRAFECASLDAVAWSAFPKIRPGEFLFINVSPGSLADADVFEHSVLQSLSRRGVDLRQIVFEIVESGALPPLRDLMVTVERMRAYEARVALDDMGKGFATIQSVLDIEPDIVKLDRELLGIEEQSGCGLIESLVRLAHSVSSEVVAEGIETADQFDLAASAGVDFAQGWYIGRPSAEPCREFGPRPFVG